MAQAAAVVAATGARLREAPPPAPRRQPDGSIGRRAMELAAWLIPGMLLAFFPKCPLCVAGYVALATGLGVSLTAATYLRWTLLVLCLASLGLMVVRYAGRWLGRRAT